MSQDDAKNFTIQSCMAFGVAGAELDSMWGCVIEMSYILDLTVEEAVASCDIPHGIDEFISRLEVSAREVFNTATDIYEAIAHEREINDPDVFGSAITQSAIKAGRDRSGGVTYHNATVECIGLANVSDGVGAIKKLVYDEKKIYTC